MVTNMHYIGNKWCTILHGILSYFDISTCSVLLVTYNKIIDVK